MPNSIDAGTGGLGLVLVDPAVDAAQRAWDGRYPEQGYLSVSGQELSEALVVAAGEALAPIREFLEGFNFGESDVEAFVSGLRPFVYVSEDPVVPVVPSAL